MILALALAGPVRTAAAIADHSPRIQVSLNAGWRFFSGDEPKAVASGFDDSGWQSVDLPHTWNAQDGQDGGDNYRRGAGWYRRSVMIDASLAGRQLYLQFDGASLKAEVYVNGRFLGTHTGGFARFRFDATAVFKPGAGNLVAVRVDNRRLGIPPISADFTFFGGLYRGVSLLATDPVQISATDFASAGVYVTQHNVTAAHANVACRTLVENHATSEQQVEVKAAVLLPEGTVVQSHTTTLTLAAGAKAQAEQPLPLDAPRMWNGRNGPSLYTVRVELRVAGQLRDSITQPLGIRAFRVDPNEGAFINDRYYDLVGVCRHQDRIDRGWAISESDEAEDFALIQELGATAIRVAHYQQSESWYDRCDRAGLVAWAEIPFVNEALATPEFIASAKQQLRELIRQDFNHPAILCWGIGNETQGNPANGVLAELAQVVREEDPGRYSVYASNHRADDPRNFQPDLVAFNRYYGWYGGEFAELGKSLDDTHQRYPKAAIGISEYGAGASIRQHEENPPKRAAKSRFHPEEYQNKFHEASWLALKARPYVWCKFIWNMFDFAADPRDEGDHPGRNDKGLVTYDRKVRKDAFYFYKASWSTEPVVYLASRRFTPRAQAVTEVKVYANAPAVELFVNAVSQGVQRGSDCIFRWPGITLRPGDNRIEARADFGGQGVTDACTWVLDPAKAAPIPAP
jgi:beta-galactosidase